MPPLKSLPLPMKRTFFQLADKKWMLLITSGLGLLVWSWLSPTTIPGPYGLYLGPLGFFGQYLGTTFPGVIASIVFIAALLHLGEALFAVKLCRDHRLTAGTTVKWFFQTLCFGVASLRILWKRSQAAKRS